MVRPQRRPDQRTVLRRVEHRRADRRRLQRRRPDGPDALLPGHGQLDHRESVHQLQADALPVQLRRPASGHRRDPIPTTTSPFRPTTTGRAPRSPPSTRPTPASGSSRVNPRPLRRSPRSSPAISPCRATTTTPALPSSPSTGRAPRPGTSRALPANPNVYGLHVVSSNLYTIAFGGNGDVPVPASYFTTATDHSITEAVWRPSLDEYLIRTYNGGTEYASFALNGVPQTSDIPAPGDYSGTGVIQPGVYRPDSNPPEFLVSAPVTTAKGGDRSGPGPDRRHQLRPAQRAVLLPRPEEWRRDDQRLRDQDRLSRLRLHRRGPDHDHDPRRPPHPAAAPAPVKAAVTLLRVRPAQAVAVKAATPVDDALASFGSARSGRLFGGLL